MEIWLVLWVLWGACATQAFCTKLHHSWNELWAGALLSYRMTPTPQKQPHSHPRQKQTALLADCNVSSHQYFYYYFHILMQVKSVCVHHHNNDGQCPQFGIFWVLRLSPFAPFLPICVSSLQEILTNALNCLIIILLSHCTVQYQTTKIPKFRNLVLY